MEIWKDIPLFDNLYQASNLGNIRSKDKYVTKKCGFSNIEKEVKQFYKGKNLSLCKSDKYGHLNVRIGFNGKKYTLSVHRVVLMAFIGMPPKGTEACHNNGLAWDNRIDNLRWDTHANNNNDRKLHGNYKSGKDHHMYGKKLSDKFKANLIAINTGKKASEETKRKMTESQLKRWEKIRVSKQKTA